MIDPHWILSASAHLAASEMPHHAQRSVHEHHRHIIRFNRARMTGLHRDRRLPSRRCGVLEISRVLRILRTIRRDDDVIEAERQHHPPRECVLLGLAGLVPIRIRPQALVDVAAVEVDHVIGLLDDLRDQVRGAIGLGAVHFARIHPVHVLAVGRIKVRDDFLERRNVHKRQDDHGAGELRRIDLGDQFLERDDRRVFGAVGAGEQRQHRTGLGAVRDCDRNRHRRVAAGRHFDGAGRCLTSGGLDGADGEHRAVAGLALREYLDEEKSNEDARRERSSHHDLTLIPDSPPEVPTTAARCRRSAPDRRCAIR